MKRIAAAEQSRILEALVPSYFRAHFAQIPSLSAHASYVLSQTENLEALDNNKLSAMLRIDPPSAAELLHLVNSPLYHRGHAVSSIDEAIVRVGHREVYALMVSLATRSLFEPSMRSLYALLPHQWYRLQSHAVVSGFAASWLAEHLNLGQSELAFVAGMFHDIGKLGALFCICGLILDEQIDFEVTHVSAAEVMEQTHVDIGVEMVSNWRLAEPIRAICAKMHSAMATDDPLTPLCHCVRVVSNLDSLRDNSYLPPNLDLELRQSLAALQLSGAKLQEVAKKLQSITDTVKNLLGGADASSASMH